MTTKTEEKGHTRIRTREEDGDPCNFPPEYLCQDGVWRSVYGLDRCTKGLSDINNRTPDPVQMKVSALRLEDYRAHVMANNHEPLKKALLDVQRELMSETDPTTKMPNWDHAKNIVKQALASLEKNNG